MNWKEGDIAICISHGRWYDAITDEDSDGPKTLEENRVSSVNTYASFPGLFLFFDKYGDDYLSTCFRKKIDHSETVCNVNVKIEPAEIRTPKRKRKKVKTL